MCHLIFVWHSALWLFAKTNFKRSAFYQCLASLPSLMQIMLISCSHLLDMWKYIRFKSPQHSKRKLFHGWEGKSAIKSHSNETEGKEDGIIGWSFVLFSKFWRYFIALSYSLLFYSLHVFYLSFICTLTFVDKQKSNLRGFIYKIKTYSTGTFKKHKLPTFNKPMWASYPS